MKGSDDILDSKLKPNSGIFIDAMFDLITREVRSEGSETYNVYL
jgi:hypothetical protein